MEEERKEKRETLIGMSEKEKWPMERVKDRERRKGRKSHQMITYTLCGISGASTSRHRLVPLRSKLGP